MDREDRRRYFVVGSVIIEIVTPVFRKKIENDYKSKGVASLQDFLDQPPILHILFHLRHKNTWCCQDRPNCISGRALPLNHSQWNMLYSQKTGFCNRLCYCKYKANPAKTEDMDTTLASLILLNCCTLTSNEDTLIEDLRLFKNNYLSHNVDGGISLDEYNTLWKDLTNYVLQLDPSKKDELKMIEMRPLDDSLCKQYVGSLLDVHKKLDEIETKIDVILDVLLKQNAELMKKIEKMEIETKMDVNHDVLLKQNAELMEKIEKMEMDTKMDVNHDVLIRQNAELMEKIEVLIKRGTSCECAKNKISKQNEPYRLGQDIFTLHHQYNLTSVPNVDRIGHITGGVMMDDGRLVLRLYNQKRLLICNTDGSEGDSIPLQSRPCNVTAVNNSTVAVTRADSCCIEMYNINNKQKLKSISVPDWCYGITTINNKLVVGCYKGRLLMIDGQTGEEVRTVNTYCQAPFRLHTSGDRIFYCDSPYYINDNLYCYSYTDDKVTTLKLQSRPCRITSLQDHSLYVVCEDGSVQHVSSDGQHYKPVKTKGLEALEHCYVISYNGTQRKLLTCDLRGNVQIFEHN